MILSFSHQRVDRSWTRLSLFSPVVLSVSLALSWGVLELISRVFEVRYEASIFSFYTAIPLSVLIVFVYWIFHSLFLFKKRKGSFYILLCNIILAIGGYYLAIMSLFVFFEPLLFRIKKEIYHSFYDECKNKALPSNAGGFYALCEKYVVGDSIIEVKFDTAEDALNNNKNNFYKFRNIGENFFYMRTGADY